MSRTVEQPRSVRCVVMRGGTSRGMFFHACDLPLSGDARDRLLMAVVGGPDPRQVDGLGGADLLLSKVAVVWPSERPDADVECRFGSIPPGSGIVKYGANCGNLASAVACFARQEGLAGPAAERVRIYNPDSGTLMEARTCGEEPAGMARLAEMSGMPPTGELVELTFLNPAGTAGGRLLPTGRVVDRLEMPDGRSVAASIVDAGAMYVFLPAEAMDLSSAAGDGAPQSEGSMRVLEHLRGQAAVLAGLARTPAEATTCTPAVPKLAFVAPPADYCTEDRRLPIAAGQVDLVGRIVSSQSHHRAYAVTGAIATAVAAALPGSVVHGAARGGPSALVRHVRIGHPTGIIECTIESGGTGEEIVVKRASFLRTARRIMEGRCFLPFVTSGP